MMDKPNYLLHPSLDFFVCFGVNQTFLNIFERSNQKSVQLNCSFSIVLTKYQEHGSHVVVVLELHLAELHFSYWVSWCTSILNIILSLSLSLSLICIINYFILHSITKNNYLTQKKLVFSKMQLHTILN